MVTETTRGLIHSEQPLAVVRREYQDMEPSLTRDEDADLRRLNVLALFGELAPDAAARFEELRQRDRRTEIREPDDVVIPAQRRTSRQLSSSLWD